MLGRLLFGLLGRSKAVRVMAWQVASAAAVRFIRVLVE